jgi:ABC-type long-subunit fatty acid transport system fused permease/ATPase subunit
MRKFLKGATMALMVASTVFGIAGTAYAATIGISLPGISVGFRDGYMDNNHRYHAWKNQRDYRNYRSQHAATYSDWNHDRR